MPSAAEKQPRRTCAPTLQSCQWPHPDCCTNMDVTRSVASPSDDIKAAAVFEKDALLSAQTMIYVRGRRPYAVGRRDATLPHTGRRRDEEDAAE